jgi:hypothetical protein
MGGGTQGEGREGECCEFEHAQILFSVVPLIGVRAILDQRRYTE